MADPEILQEWISKAEDDFQFALATLLEKKPYHAHICFLFQQSAEKYLKAFILDRGLKFQKTRDLVALLKKCLETTSSFGILADDCDLLATFYVETRYPVHWPATFAQEDAELAHRASNRVRKHVRKELGLS